MFKSYLLSYWLCLVLFIGLMICLIPITIWTITGSMKRAMDDGRLLGLSVVLLTTFFLLMASSVVLLASSWESGVFLYTPQHNMDYIPVIVTSLIFVFISCTICFLVLWALWSFIVKDIFDYVKDAMHAFVASRRLNYRQVNVV